MDNVIAIDPSKEERFPDMKYFGGPETTENYKPTCMFSTGLDDGQGPETIPDFDWFKGKKSVMDQNGIRWENMNFWDRMRAPIDEEFEAKATMIVIWVAIFFAAIPMTAFLISEIVKILSHV